jgi:ABC-type uncharacterized transport system substrate-binding protein
MVPQVRIPFAVRRLALSLALIAAASTVLLVSDSGARKRKAKSGAKIALFQFAPHPLLDDFMAGVREGLAQKGYVEPSTTFRKFTADADVNVANTVAREVTGGGWDMVVTATTPCLQAVARANGRGKVMHVFALTSDPWRAGIGLDRKTPEKHPRHIVGHGSFQPVADAFLAAREINPSVSRIGVVWNTSEINSELQLEVARATCKTLGIELVEAPAETPTAVYESAASLVTNGVEAIWVPGDNLVINAIGSVIQAGRQGKIPVFTSQPGNVAAGSLFDVGPDQHELGRLTGDLAGRILSKEVDPATIPIQDLMPKILVVNPAALAGTHGWSLSPAVLAKADGVLEGTTVKRRKASRARGKTWRIRLIHYNDAPFSEDAETGLLDELKKNGLVPERDYEVTIRSAQGDVATATQLVQSAESERVDLVVTTSTPTLQAAIQRVKRAPLVFTVVADPIAAGAGKSFEDHLPNLTGIATAGDYGRLVDLMKRCLPRATRVGTLFTPSEVNSVKNLEQVEAEAKKRGITLVALPADTSADVANAAQALVGKDLDAVLQIPGNLTAMGFASIAQAAERARLPLFSYLTRDAKLGSVVTVSRDYVQAGRDAATMAVRIMKGESPAKIPIQMVSVSTVGVNLATAAKLGLTIPDSVRREATEVIER